MTTVTVNQARSEEILKGYRDKNYPYVWSAKHIKTDGTPRLGRYRFGVVKFLSKNQTSQGLRFSPDPRGLLGVTDMDEARKYARGLTKKPPYRFINFNTLEEFCIDHVRYVVEDEEQ